MANAHGRGQVLKIDDLAGSLADISAYLNSIEFPIAANRPAIKLIGKKAEERPVLGLRQAGPLRINGPFYSTAYSHGRSADVLMGTLQLQDNASTVSITRTIDIPALSLVGGTFVKCGPPGHVSTQYQVGGPYNDAASGFDAKMLTMLAASTSSVVSIGYSGYAIGAYVDLLKVAPENYSLSGPADNIITCSGSGGSDSSCDLGVSLHALSAETAAGDYTAVDETASSALGGVGHLHITAFTGTNVTVAIQDSADGSTDWQPIITFTQATGATSERKETASLTSTVRRYVRASLTGTAISSVTFQVSFARYGFAYGTAGTYRHFCGLLQKAATTSYEYGPSGSGSGAKKHSGELRLSSLATNVDASALQTFSAEFMVDGVNTEGTF